MGKTVKLPPSHNRKQVENPSPQINQTATGSRLKCHLPECKESVQQEKLPEVQFETPEKEIRSSEIEMALDMLKDAFTSQSMSKIRHTFEAAGRDMEVTAARLRKCTVPLEQSNSQQITTMATEQEIPTVTEQEAGKETEKEKGVEGDQQSEETSQQPINAKQITTPKTKKRIKIKRPQEKLSPENDARHEVRVPNESLTIKKPQQSPPQKKSRNCKSIETVFAKFQSLDEETEREDRRKIMADIQAHELEANYLFDDELPKVIQAILTENEGKRWTYGVEWGKVWKALRVKTADNRHVLYMDSKLVIPKTMRISLQNTIHFGHWGPVNMLHKSKDLWWPGLYTWIFSTGNLCNECRSNRSELSDDNLFWNGERVTAVLINNSLFGETWAMK